MNPDTWICDACGETIKDQADGWVEWLRNSESRECRGLRLVHHQPASPRNPAGSCQYDSDVEWNSDQSSLVNDLSLEFFLGSDGLMRLLAMLSDGTPPADEVIEMIKRLYIPGYEHAHRHFEHAIAEGVIEPDTKFGFFPQRDIQATLRLVLDN